MAINKIELAGNLTNEPMMKTVKGNAHVTEARIAVNRPKGGADFIAIACWEELAKELKTARKGTRIELEGRLRVESWGQGKNFRTKAVVVASKLTVHGAAPAQSQDEPAAGPAEQPEPEAAPKKRRSRQPVAA